MILYFHYQISRNKSDIRVCTKSTLSPKYDLHRVHSGRYKLFNVSLPITVRVDYLRNRVMMKEEIKDIKTAMIFYGRNSSNVTDGRNICDKWVHRRGTSLKCNRSPGVFYTHDGGKQNSTGKYLYSASVSP